MPLPTTARMRLQNIACGNEALVARYGGVCAFGTENAWIPAKPPSGNPRYWHASLTGLVRRSLQHCTVMLGSTGTTWHINEVCLSWRCSLVLQEFDLCLCLLKTPTAPKNVCVTVQKQTRRNGTVTHSFGLASG